jgi:diamine N-acetyltransferase
MNSFAVMLLRIITDKSAKSYQMGWENKMNSDIRDSKNVVLKSQKVLLRPFAREDVEKRFLWKPYPDPLYFHYNMPEMTEDQKEAWYLKRKSDLTALWLSIEDLGGQLVGLISLYKMEPKTKTAWVGIYLGYEFIDQGMGTDAMLTLLRYYFEEMQFELLFLDVASHNKRAISCYQKCGFEFFRKKCSDHDPRMNIDIFGDERYQEIREYFKKDGKKVLVEFDEMELSKTKYEEINQNKN